MNDSDTTTRVILDSLVAFYYLAQKEICTPGVEILFG